MLAPRLYVVLSIVEQADHPVGLLWICSRTALWTQTVRDALAELVAAGHLIRRGEKEAALYWIPGRTIA